MQPSPLETRLAKLRAQVRRLLALHGLGLMAGILVPIVVLLGLADWLVHLDAVVRLIALATFVGYAGWLLFRHVATPLFVRFADLDIALRIEQRWPGLNDRLASTVQFLHVEADDDRFGSPAFREATIRQTLEETKGIDFRQAIEPRPVLKVLGIASAMVALGVVVVVAAPTSSSIALRRLFLPFGSTRWPQATHLTLIDRETPRKVAKGDPFTVGVSVAKGDRIPASARVTYRFDDGEAATEPLGVVEGGIFRGRLESVDRGFTFSVAAGDDSTSITNVAVKVVPPPAIKELTVRLVSPSYTGQEAQTLAPGVTQIKAVDGTRVELSALANKPIESASLQLGESPAKPEVAFDKARTRLSAQFTASQSFPFWFSLRDTEGFSSREAVRYELRSARDEAPRVVIDDPDNDRDVPAQAKVPVAFTVDDDFGIQSASLLYQVAVGGSEPTQVVVLPLWDSKGQPQERSVRHQQVRYTWDLAPLKLSPGSIITFHAEAKDFDDLKGPNLGKSRQLRFRIVSDEEAGRQLDDMRREIREETARILAIQKQAQTPVDEAIRTLSKTDKLAKPERENLKDAEMIQRQVESRINSKADGLDQKVRRFLDDLRNFKLANPEAQAQMEQMRAGVDRIREKHLDPAEQGLVHASKNLDEAEAGDASKPQENPAKDDAAAAKAEPDDARPDRPSGKSEAGKTAKAASKGPEGAKPGDESKAAEKAESGQPSSPDAKTKGGEPKGADAPKDAADRPKPSTKAGFTEAARKALAESKASQQEIADELQKMLDGLSEFETYRGVVKDAQNLLKEQEQAMKQADETAEKPDLMGKATQDLTPEQKADLANLAARQGNVAKGLQGLQERMEEMAKRVGESDPLAASALKESAEQSRKQGTAAKMGEASDRIEKNQMGQARAAQEQARRDLKDMIDSIQNRRERELSHLVKELKAAEAELGALRQRQTENLKKTQEAKKNPDAKQRADQLKKLAKEQEQIQEELKKQLKRLRKLNAEGAAQAGDRAAGKMGKAQEDLDQDQGDEAGKEQEEALADLEDAEEQVREARKEKEEQLAAEQLLKMGEQLKSLAERQEKMVNDIAGYDKLRSDAKGKLTMAQRTGVRNLGQVQAGLKDETGELVERLEGAPVFALTLKRATDAMETSAQRLQSIKTDDETQRAARSAANRFKQLIDSLKPDKPNGGGQQQGGGDQGGGGGGGGDGIPPTAQIKVLKSLQEEINERTDFYDELRRRKKALDPTQTAELERLETDQGTLADLARDMTRPKKDDGED